MRNVSSPYVVYSSMRLIMETDNMDAKSILPGACMSLVLASASPRLRKLLQQLGLDLKIDPSSVEEVFDESI